MFGVGERASTRDINLLGHVVSIFQDICELEVELDGLELDANEVDGESIIEDANYEGVRITVMARLGKTQLPIQIDIGFADVITPAPTIVDFLTILDFPAPHLYGYAPETVIAEKFQAMTALGMTNSRMKDFYDIWRLVDYFEFDGKILQNAIRRTFDYRSTELPSETHVIFSDEFAVNKRA